LNKDKKIKIHVKNNHWAPGSFPTDAEGEKNFTITKEHLNEALKDFPEIKDKLEIFVDWDEENFDKSMSNSDVLLAWNFPTKNLKKISPNLKWIHVVSAGVEHLLPLDWMFDDLVLTNSSGVHAKKAGEYGLMAILMLQNHMTKIVTNQKKKEFVSLFSNPIAGKTVVVVGTGSLGSSMAKHIKLLGANVIGVNKKGKKVDECNEVITIENIDNVLPKADFLYLAVPETPDTKNLISKEKLNMLKPTCGIVNVGRQSVMDYEALCEKLNNNEIAGAILDVFTQEPLDKSSKLWDTPNLILTPHVSSDDNGDYVRLTLNIFIKNLKLFIENKDLVNQIDKKLGY
jgi:phosphoglycerate dehydrogenase-like enzyme